MLCLAVTLQFKGTKDIHSTMLAMTGFGPRVKTGQNVSKVLVEQRKIVFLEYLKTNKGPLHYSQVHWQKGQMLLKPATVGTSGTTCHRPKPSLFMPLPCYCFLCLPCMVSHTLTLSQVLHAARKDDHLRHAGQHCCRDFALPA